MDSNDENKICLLYGNASEDLALNIARYWGGIGKDSSADNMLAAKKLHW